MPAAFTSHCSRSRILAVAWETVAYFKYISSLKLASSQYVIVSSSIPHQQPPYSEESDSFWLRSRCFDLSFCLPLMLTGVFDFALQLHSSSLPTDTTSDRLFGHLHSLFIYLLIIAHQYGFVQLLKSSQFTSDPNIITSRVAPCRLGGSQHKTPAPHLFLAGLTTCRID